MTVKIVDERPTRPLVAITLAAGLLVVVAFQVALTMGAPMGAAAMGGVNSGRLPDELRVVTGLSAVAWSFAALVVLARGDRAVVPVRGAVVRVGPWVLVGLLALGSLMNVASSGPWERFGWGPFTFILFGLCLVLARSGYPTSAPVNAKR